MGYQWLIPPTGRRQVKFSLLMLVFVAVEALLLVNNSMLSFQNSY